MSSKGKDAQLTEIINSNFQHLIQDLEAYLHENDEKIAKEQDAIFTPQIQQLQNMLSDAKQQYDDMDSRASESNQEIIQKEAVLQRMVNLSSQLHSRIRNGNTCSRFFKSWVADGTNKDVLYNSFYAIYIQRAFKRSFFRRWSRMMFRKRDRRLTRDIKSKYDKEMKSKSADFDRQISDLEEQVAAARAELNEKQQNFLEMQQKIKKSFMRGVVNLNLEAMDVFNGAQLMSMMQEIEGGEKGIHDKDAPIDESDDDFYVEEAPKVTVVRH